MLCTLLLNYTISLTLRGSRIKHLES